MLSGSDLTSLRLGFLELLLAKFLLQLDHLLLIALLKLLDLASELVLGLLCDLLNVD